MASEFVTSANMDCEPQENWFKLPFVPGNIHNSEAKMQTVLARGDRGEPLRRLLIEVGSGLAYLANPLRIDAVLAGESDPVGFPLQDVFLFEDDVFERLKEDWGKRNATDPSLWQAAVLYRPRPA